MSDLMVLMVFDRSSVLQHQMGAMGRHSLCGENSPRFILRWRLYASAHGVKSTPCTNVCFSGFDIYYSTQGFSALDLQLVKNL